jgi:hypothetical protein
MVGTITATVALIVLGFVALGLYTSLPGLLIAGSIAAIVGAAKCTCASDNSTIGQPSAFATSSSFSMASALLRAITTEQSPFGHRHRNTGTARRLARLRADLVEPGQRTTIERKNHAPLPRWETREVGPVRLADRPHATLVGLMVRNKRHIFGSAATCAPSFVTASIRSSVYVKRS